MKKTALLTLGALGLCMTLSAQVKGYVYEDSNRNGKKERSEKGIPEVSVTNGIEVVQTDAKGYYELPENDDQIIAVVKPSGYTLPLNDKNLPQFYRIHKPGGSPDLKYKGVAPTGKLPRHVNFPLYASDEAEAFTALVFGDPQAYNKEEIDYFYRGIVAEVEGIENIPLGISLGDLVGNDLDLFAPYAEAISRIGIPWYNVMGNHDMDFDAGEDRHSDETYESAFGPNNYAFNYGKVHFIILDDILYPDPRDGKGYWGGFRKDQLDFVENDLKYVPKDHLIVLAFHIPLSEPGGDAFRDEDRQRLFDILADFPHTLSLSAHTHLQKQDFFGKEDGWTGTKPHHSYNVGTTSGDWYSGKLNDKGIPVSTMRDGTPKGYAFIHFNGNEYTLDYKVAGAPDTHQMNIFAPKVVAKGRKTSAGIYVNYFMGSENDTVEYRIGQGRWRPMKYVQEPDPSYVQQVYEWDTTGELFPGRRSSNPVISTHLWRGSIPTNLDTGIHKIEVRVKDIHGRTHKGESSYELAEPVGQD
ncbi:calcineurin-like phosphoesterase C-terminal domain-containing protein [Sinomicrobium soli]|uniref:calcineurin-like phosphoesterase C-terminal domain-containing protein n=1 Tax=Sinomicrobium sp. N-1-3-6 TaxID=2219864 RepID=UPI000DCE7F8E|nr:calcineurin-like phosphoesterase family protein [Sinomicrobium sp. N-1-3-6]RAV30304.1 metallophosphoesterase [Sinomicrobium sp. N-1-3-6]